MCVEFATSPSIATTSPRTASAASVSPNALRVAIASAYTGSTTFGTSAGGETPASGLRGVTETSRGPPSSAIARSASSCDRALPCHPYRFARNETPCPFSVLAITIAGPSEPSASVNAASIAATS